MIAKVELHCDKGDFFVYPLVVWRLENGDGVTCHHHHSRSAGNAGSSDIGSLRFGARAKTIQNKVSQNVQRSAEELMIIVQTLKSELMKMRRYSSRLEKQIAYMKSPEYDPSKPLPKVRPFSSSFPPKHSFEGYGMRWRPSARRPLAHS